MGYMHKVTFYGKYIQTTEYAKEISTERVCPSAFFKERVRNPFAKRRLNNIRKSKRLFVQRVLCGLGSLGTPLFVTLTYAENFGDIGLGNRHLRLFFQRLRKSHKGIEYVAVPEYQERGALHYHILLFGAPLEWGDVYSKTAITTYRGIKRKKVISYGTERSTRYLSSLWAHGFVDVVATDGSDGFAGYLAKYMVKASSELPSSVRCYNFSLAFPKPVCLKGTDFNLLQRFQKGVPLYESQYLAPWLGQVIVKTYVRN